MKKLLLSALAIASIGSANAQIFTENFDSGIPANFTLTDVDGLTPNTNVAVVTDPFTALNLTDANSLAKDAAVSTSWFTTGAQADDWMSTPSIALPTTTSAIVLEFNATAPDAAYADGVEIYISTTGATASDFTGAAIYNTTSTGEPDVWTARQVDITAYAGQTIYIGFRNNSNDKYLLGIDDVVVRELLPDNAEMTSLSAASYVAAGNVTISGVITNQGGNAITSMDVIWNDGSGPQTDALTGLNIASGATYNFNHAIPLVAVAGTSYSINVSVAAPNDGDATDDALTTNVVALTSIPAKIVVGEENTGTWCQFCPAGAVGLANMESEADFIGIAVHDSDPMEVSAYNTASATLFPDFTGYPNGAVDRVYGTYPSAAGFLAEHNTRKNEIAPCAVNTVNATFNPTTNMVAVSTVAEFFGNMTGDFRLSCVIVQDDMSSAANSGWSQVNAYAGGGTGPAFPAGINNGYDFGAGTNPAPAAAFGGYDHTARSLSNNDIYGDAGSISTNPTIGTYSHTFADVSTTTMPGAGDVPFDASKAHAVVMIVAPNGQILNAGKASISVVTSTEEAAEAAKFQLNVFPNPTLDNATVSFSLENDENVTMEVYNAMGALVYADNAGKLTKGNHKMAFNGEELNSGFYFVNLTIGNNVITKKVTLTK